MQCNSLHTNRITDYATTVTTTNHVGELLVVGQNTKVIHQRVRCTTCQLFSYDIIRDPYWLCFSILSIPDSDSLSFFL